MAPRKQKQTSADDRTVSTYEDAQKAGYLGYVPDPNPNEAYSLQSGPDSPTTTAEDVAETTAPDKGDSK